MNLLSLVTSWLDNICQIITKGAIGTFHLLYTNKTHPKFACSSSDTVYELEPLSDTDSKRLLCERVFNKGDKFPSDLEDASKKFLRKCGGVPLAIITIASMLASRPDKTKYEWYKVYNSMGRGLEKDKSQEKCEAYYLLVIMICLPI
jgi:disease resistance protein RPM1